jgi:hypothetical protein
MMAWAIMPSKIRENKGPYRPYVDVFRRRGRTILVVVMSAPDNTNARIT